MGEYLAYCIWWKSSTSFCLWALRMQWGQVLVKCLATAWVFFLNTLCFFENSSYFCVCMPFSQSSPCCLPFADEPEVWEYNYYVVHHCHSQFLHPSMLGKVLKVWSICIMNFYLWMFCYNSLLGLISDFAAQAVWAIALHMYTTDAHSILYVPIT